MMICAERHKEKMGLKRPKEAGIVDHLRAGKSNKDEM